MKNIILFLWLTILMGACKENKMSGTVINTDVNVLLVNNKGENLIKTKLVTAQSIKVFNIIDGVTKEVFDQNSDYPRHFYIYKPVNERDHSDNDWIRVFANIADTSPVTSTIVKWNDLYADTIKTEITRSGNSTVVTRVWLNDVLKWDVEIGKKLYNSGEIVTPRFIKIVK